MPVVAAKEDVQEAPKAQVAQSNERPHRETGGRVGVASPHPRPPYQDR